MPEFSIDARLLGNSLPVADLTLSAVLLVRDANYPWLILVPRRAGLADIIDLASADRTELMAEIATASEALRATVRCDKLNVAALGNMVRQLHVHVVARTSDDAAWPRPVWGVVSPKEYPPGAAEALAAEIRKRLV